MGFTRPNNMHLTALLTLGIFLVVADLGELYQDFQRPGAHPAGSHHLLIGSVSAGLAALLAAALVLLQRSLFNGGKEQRMAPRAADRPQELAEWQQTFDSMADLVSVHGRDFRIVRANSAFCEFLGKKREEVIGRYCYELLHNQDHPIDGCPHAKAQQVGHPVTMAIHDPYQGVPLLITCSPFVDQQGNFAGSVHMARLQTALDSGAGSAPPRYIPICASCKNIRDENGNWVKIEDYVRLRFNGLLTHSICKECQKKIYPQFLRD